MLRGLLPVFILPGGLVLAYAVLEGAGLFWLIEVFGTLYSWGVRKRAPACRSCSGSGRTAPPRKMHRILKILLVLVFSALAFLWLFNNGYFRAG